MECGMIYRRVTEVTEVDQPTIPGLPNHWSKRPSFGRSGFNNQAPKMGPFLKRKRSMKTWEDRSLSEEVRSFKRVRILSRIKKARRAAFASWEHKASWSVTESDQIVTVTGDDRFGAESTSTAEVDVTFRNLVPESNILSGATFLPSVEDKQSRKRVLAHTLDSEKNKISWSLYDALDPVDLAEEDIYSCLMYDDSEPVDVDDEENPRLPTFEEFRYKIFEHDHIMGCLKKRPS